MLLLIDNYDSFTYNLVQYISEVAPQHLDVVVRRNDSISVEDTFNLQPQYIVISPGPCTPNEAGISIQVIQAWSGKIPILGVCLGHQAIAAAFGGEVVRAPSPMHGKISTVKHNGEGLFAGIPNPFKATRYHSLTVKAETLPECLISTAWSEGLIMGLEHRHHRDTVGVQFHPESVLTDDGKALLRNFLVTP
mgnify:CR=1 FL=1